MMLLELIDPYSNNKLVSEDIADEKGLEEVLLILNALRVEYGFSHHAIRQMFIAGMKSGFARLKEAK